MKRLIYLVLTVLLCQYIISCSKTCSCDELIYDTDNGFTYTNPKFKIEKLFKDKELFTGDCQKVGYNDQILSKKNYKNGCLLYCEEWIELAGNRLKVEEMEYRPISSEAKPSYYTGYRYIFNLSLEDNMIYSRSYFEYLNWKEIKAFNFSNRANSHSDRLLRGKYYTFSFENNGEIICQVQGNVGQSGLSGETLNELLHCIEEKGVKNFIRMPAQ